MRRLSRRAALAGTFAIAGAGAARGEEPPLKLVLGFPPGASSDTLTRLIADKMRVSLGRTVVVENKPGRGRHRRQSRRQVGGARR